MNRFERQFVKLVLMQSGIFIVAFGIWFYLTTRAYLAAPAEGDLYGHTWSFQALNVCMFYLPPCVVALTVILLVERVVLRRWEKRKQDHEAHSLA
jgi:hypothetical protein